MNNKSIKKKTIKKKKRKTYKKKHFNSGEGMLTTVWGPSIWHFLHTMSFNYPVNPTKSDKKNYRNFILNLQNILPCKYCRINLKRNFKAHPLKLCDMKNRDTFSKYIYKLHELINKMLKKKSGLTYCQVRERYENFRARCTKKEIKHKIKKTKKRKKEKGCVNPLHGKKTKCIIRIIPKEVRTPTLKIDNRCKKI